MNKLFSKSALYAVINPINALDETEYDYEKFYVGFFEAMKTECSAYTKPEWLKTRIHKQSVDFIADFRAAFCDTPDIDKINKQVLECNKGFKNMDEYFNALRMKFAGNLLEAVMEVFFKHSNSFDPRLQAFTKYEGTNNSSDDFNGVDGWLSSADGIRIPVNAKHLANDVITREKVYKDLKSAADTEWQEYDDAVWVKCKKLPRGVIFTDSCVGRSEAGREMKSEKFPNVIIIDETTLFKAIGTPANSIPNLAFWNAAFTEIVK